MPGYNVHSLTLYCDNRRKSVNVPYRPGMYPKDLQGQEPIILKTGEHYDGEFPMEFLASDAAEAKKQAKTLGWYFFRDGRTLCPRCNIGGIKIKKGDEIPLTSIPKNKGDIKE
jgi:hypothetical protein